MLRLYNNAGFTLGAAPFNDAERKLDSYQRGLKHAENFLTQGETAAGVREYVLILYNSISVVFGRSGQKSLGIQQLPALGLWSWRSLAKVEKRAEILGNWRIHLQTAPAYPDFTAAFQDLLHTVLLKWHSPERPHRHFAPTETLLAISESLYGLEQAEENQRLKTVYDQLQTLHSHHTVQDAEGIEIQYCQLIQQLQARWQKIGIQPLTPDNEAALQTLAWWQKIRYGWTIRQLRQDITTYQQLPTQSDIANNDERWQRAVKRTEKAIFDWLHEAIKKQLKLPPIGLEDLSAIALGILLVNNTKGKCEPEFILKKWQQHPPWQDAESLQTALAGSHWEKWIVRKEPPLYEWLDLLRIFDPSPCFTRLNVALGTTNFEQPDLQSWLSELKKGKSDKLAAQLKSAWEVAQEKATFLARFFMALSNFDFQGALFAPVQQDSDDYYFHFQSALAAVILGDAPQQVRQALQTWLQQQGTLSEKNSVFDTLEALKNRFTRAVSIYQPSHPPLKDTVHDWAKVLIREVLEKESNPAETLWHLLERARIGLMGLTMTLPDEWDKTLGEALWNGLRKTIDEIGGGHVPAENAPWLPIEIWIYQLREWMEDRPPKVEICQAHLQPNEALVQPFFDPIQKRLRILWLDKNILEIKDLPDECALEHLWSEQTQTGIIKQWTRGLDEVKAEYRRGGNLGDQVQDWGKVMDSPPVKILADTLNQWATGLQQITVIFPAPLGQLPWEILPQLAAKCVREISVAHWLQHTKKGAVGYNEVPTHPTSTTSTTSTSWVICDPSGEKECMIKDGQWVANQLNTKLEKPCPSIFDALSQLEHSHHAHLSTHGFFFRNDPIRSFLTLDNDKKIHLPLWITSAVRTNAELIMLAACESNLNGQDTEGLLTPIGIGPSLAAAGAKTVIGTLWSCDGVAAICFTYHFYTIAKENDTLPWHQVVAQARQKVRNMTISDLEALAETLNLNDINDECCFSVEYHTGQTVGDYPFKKAFYWAGFTVLGQVDRKG